MTSGTTDGGLTCGRMLRDALEEEQQVLLPFSPYSCTLCHLRKITFIGEFIDSLSRVQRPIDEPV